MVGTSTSIWQAIAAPTTYPPLARDLAVDVAIVGGGITGLTTALLLKRAGLSVAVLEALEIETSATSHTTGHISEVPDIGYRELIANFGEDAARLAVQSRRAAIDRIASIVQEEQIDCGFEYLPGYLYSESYSDLDSIDAEAKAARKLGVQVNTTTSLPLPFPTTKGIVFPNQAQFDGVAYVQALARSIDGGGSYVFEQTRVVDISGDSPTRVYTRQGTIAAQKVVLATHTPIHDITKLQDVYLAAVRAIPYQSYVLGVKTTSPLAAGLFWDTADPYHYTRRYNHPELGELLIVGGADHRTGAAENTLKPYEQLEDYVRSRYHVESIPFRWSSQWFEPTDGLPFIGTAALHPHIYLATGFSGNGISYGTIAAITISDSILNRSNPWIDLYSPGRIKPIATAARFIAQNLNISSHFVLDRFKRDVKTAAEIPPGSGKVLEIKGEQIAAYRDESGTLHARSAVCTHLGCIVNWNAAEKSWDCPCHGGRFTCTGEVLTGPQVKDLDVKSISQ
ncbi:FAD-dependent oxidoreductase [Microcoleus sp. FACHB-1515]|uniref:FAD-dependent oxidoreductase n=1 Tax=Cyanophyceae TaxID=3028117 RepID=UPI0016854D89|nr:FAD-dependent oxidoreductase [Microcoleus sp. FACHB-1515]MBD2089733.1 FAD-dependent oxidoreductase [Microcoleus sp. FACHB-1515]